MVVDVRGMNSVCTYPKLSYQALLSVGMVFPFLQLDLSFYN